jgi:hypothetical protein
MTRRCQRGVFALIQEMVAHKMVLEQHDLDADKKPITEWVFRHNKVRDYFFVAGVSGEGGTNPTPY